MKSILFLLLILPFSLHAQSEVYDLNGNRVYHTIKNGKQHFVDQYGKKIRPEDPESKQNRVSEEYDLINETGKTYYFDYGWDQVISNGKVVIEYNFNRRQYEWVEDQNVDPKGRTSSKEAARIYTDYQGYKTPEQGDIAILTYEKGEYKDEFGNTVYTVRGGGIPGWSSIVLFHDYYEKHYTGSRLDSILAIRKPYRDSLDNAFAVKNTLAEAMINLGNKYKNTVAFTSTYQVVYFSMINEKPEVLKEDKIKDIRNNWLIINENTYRRTNPFEMPEAGHLTKKKDAKNMGMSLPNGPLIIWEIKIKPEFAEDFKSMVVE